MAAALYVEHFEMASQTPIKWGEAGWVLETNRGLNRWHADTRTIALALCEQMAEPSRRSAWDLYQELDLGPGGYAIAPSTESRWGVQEALRRKLGR